MKNRYLPDTQTPPLFPGAYEPGLEAVHPRFGHFFGLLAVVSLIALLYRLAHAAWKIAGPAFGRIGHTMCRIYFRTPFGLLGLGCWIAAYGTPDQPAALIMAATGSLLLRKPLLGYLARRDRHAACHATLRRRLDGAERDALDAYAQATSAERAPDLYRQQERRSEALRQARRYRRLIRRGNRIRDELGHHRAKAPCPSSILFP